MAKKGFFKDAVGKLSMSRVIAFISVIVGTVVVVVGLIMAFKTTDADLAKVGKDIIVAGLGVFTAGSLTKAVNRIGEGLDKRPTENWTQQTWKE